MISAFGVEHGEISKSYKKLAPKLARARNRPLPTDSFQDRMKVNYVQGRENAGFLGQREVNPNKYAKNDAELVAWRGRGPDPRVLETRARTTARAKDNAQQRKKFATASVTAHSANAKRKGRVLP